MNTQNTPKPKLTLDMIAQQRADKLAEIKASKLRIANQTREIFHPTETDITILNGVITGFKIIKRIRNLFR